MFSQWRQAVESLAAHPTHASKPSQDGTADVRASRSSTDSLRQSSSSSSQLADAALTNLKKSLSSQRPASPGPNAAATTGSPRASGRTTLEERLRAKFAVGEASGNTSAASSSKSSRVGTPVTEHPLSPSSTPLPDSPATSLDIKRSSSPASIPLPDSPALTPVSRSHDDIVAHPLSESPTLEPVEERQSTAWKEVTADDETEVTPEDTILDSDPLQADDLEPRDDQLNDEVKVEVKEDPANLEEHQETAVPEDQPPLDPLQTSESVEDAHSNIPVTSSTSSTEPESPEEELKPSESAEVEVALEVEVTPKVEDIADSQLVEEPLGASTDPSTSPDVSQDVQPEVEVEVETAPETEPETGLEPEPESDAKADPVSPEPIANGHAEVQEITIPVSTPTVELSPAVDVEGLQKRLKLVEQRFAGEILLECCNSLPSRSTPDL